MKFTNTQKRAFFTFFSLFFVVVGSVIAIRYASGDYRITDEGFANQTGLLAANSFPTGSEVYVNDKLVSATDDTLYLEPGEYAVKIVKDGYKPWTKQLKIKEALVTQTDARLFPIAPSLTTLTFTGVENISPSPNGQKLLFYSASASATRKNGLYILELNSSPFGTQKEPQQIIEDNPEYNLAEAQFIWSPDSSEVMLLTDTKEVILNINQKQDFAALIDTSFQKKQILAEWEQEMFIREQQFLLQFPDEIIAIATQSAKNVYFSPDKEKLLYTATSAATLAENIIPAVLSANTQLQERQLLPGNIYIYDREEDTNFKIGQEAENSSQTNKTLLSVLDFPAASTSAELIRTQNNYTKLQGEDNKITASNFNRYHSSLYTNTLQWHPDSQHLIFTQDDQIKIVEYDGTNITTIYSGPFIKNFVYPWPDGNRLLINTSFSPTTPQNLYAIELK